MPNLAPGTRFSGRITWVEETGSTNADLLALAALGAPEGTTIVADFQTAGRGRLDRSWIAAPGSALLCSVLLRPGQALAAPWWATAAVAVAAAEATASLTGIAVRIKWPNDLAVVGAEGDERKLGGILTQATDVGTSAAALVVGLGCNLDPDLVALREVNPAATSLAGEGASPVPTAVELLDALLARLEELYGELLRDGTRALGVRYRELSSTLGADVRVNVTGPGAESIDGRAVDLTPEGALVVRSAVGGDGVGEEIVIQVGDVLRLRRPSR